MTDIYDYIASAVFPLGKTSKLWKYTNQTLETKDSVAFQQLDARIQDKPSVWFRNLKMLQIWKNLGIDCLIQINRRARKVFLGKLIAKNGNYSLHYWQRQVQTD